MASGPVTSWQIEGKKLETMTDFIFLGSKITGDGNCRHEIKILAPWKERYEKLDSILKSRDITLLTKVCIVETTVFFSSHVRM